MQLRHLFKLIITVYLFWTAPVLAAEDQLLKLGDVHGIMQQILSEHVVDRDVNPTFMQRSFKLYIDEMDPERIYFTEGELQPFINPSKEDLDRYVEEYKKGEYTSFTLLNQLGQMAIHRSRDIRKTMESEWDALYTEGLKSNAMNVGLPADPFAQIPFAKTDDELKTNIHNQIIRFIAIQIHRFGDKAVKGKGEKVMAMFERHLRLQESEFVFESVKGEAMAPAEQEHFFALHILKALASSLDAHTAFFNSVEAYDMRVRLEKGFQGIGVVLQEGIDGVVISRLVESSPAAKSGMLQINDILVDVDGKQVSDTPFAEVLEWIRGNEGTSVKLGIKRITVVDGKDEEKNFTVELKRERIVVNEERVDVSFEKYGDGIIGKIVLYSFYEGDDGISSESDMKAALQKLQGMGRIKGLVLDLRNNTGGFLIQAVKVAGLFISNGVIVTSKYSSGEEKIFRDLDGRIYYNGPMVILTSRMTASAAEIVAECLQDYGVAIIVGDERTYGKGSIQHQTVTDKNSSSYFKVTVGKYYTVSGRTPQIRGVKADIVVPTALSNEKIGEEFLDFPLANDDIPDFFNDDLHDISFEVRQWYTRYYLPTLEKKSDHWRKLLPTLQANSLKRLYDDQEYQTYLHNGLIDLASTGMMDPSETKSNMTRDYQMIEAVNIVKDMIMLKTND